MCGPRPNVWAVTGPAPVSRWPKRSSTSTALATIAHPRYTDPLRRAVSLGWADRISAPPASVEDPLTGLTTPEYLRVRLGELYRAADVSGDSVEPNLPWSSCGSISTVSAAGSEHCR